MKGDDINKFVYYNDLLEEYNRLISTGQLVLNVEFLDLRICTPVKRGTNIIELYFHIIAPCINLIRIKANQISSFV